MHILPLKNISNSTEDMGLNDLLICLTKSDSSKMFLLRTTILLNLLLFSSALTVHCEVNIVDFLRDFSQFLCRGDTAEKPHDA